MKLYSPSPLHLRRPLSSLFSVSFSTEIHRPPSPSPSPSPSPCLLPRFMYLQSVLSHIRLLSKNPNNYSSLSILDSLLANTHFLDSATSLVLIDYLSGIKKLSRSKALISHIKSRASVSDSFIYSLVFDFLVKDGTVNDVENMWAEICGSVKSFNFSNYVILVCKFGGVNEIKDIYDRIIMGVASVVERQSYVALSATLCNVNEGFLAKNLVKEMYDKGMVVDNWTYFLMFQCFCRNGVFDEADLVLRKLVKNGFFIDICIYGIFLHGLCKAGKHREANKLFKKLIQQVPVRGSRDRNLVLKEGRRAIFQLNCNVPEMMAYESYFHALCDANKLDDAEILLKKMMSGRTLPEICVYGSFIKALFRVGRDEDAMKFFKIQKKKGFVRVDEIGRYVIMGLCEKGKADDALTLFEEISMADAFVNSSNICNSILTSYLKESSVANAELFFKKWQLNEDKYGKPNVTTYTIMFNGYCNHNDASKALMVFEEMLKNKMVANGALYERIISLLCDCRRSDEAFQYLNDMIENGNFFIGKRWRVFFKSILTTDEHDVSIGS